MLILTRRQGQELLIDGRIRVVVSEARGQVKLGVDAPREIPVVRGELVEKENPNGTTDRPAA